MQRERNNIFYTDVFTEERQSSKVTEDVEFMLLSSTSFKSDVKNRVIKKVSTREKKNTPKNVFHCSRQDFFLNAV